MGNKHMQHSKADRGFSVVEVLVVIVVVAALGLGGYFVWQKSKDSKSVSKPSDKTSQTGKPDTTKPADPSEGGKYLVISEWGVRALLPEALQGDVKYGLETDTATASFEVGKIAVIPGSNCKLIDEADGRTGGIGVKLVRSQAKLPSDEERRYSTAIPQVGGYFYYIGQAKGSCLPDQSNADLDAAASLVEALKSLQSTP